MNLKLPAAALILSMCSAANASFTSAILDTLPGGISEESGFFNSTWDGLKKIFNEGDNGLLLALYTIHPAWDYPNRREENGLTWGAGITKNYIDSRGNRRLVYFMSFSDSHNNWEPFGGYAWLSRWRLGDSSIAAEAGYTLALTMRGDYKWIPIPAPLPILGVSSKWLGLYGTFVPGSNIFFFFANVTPGKVSVPSFTDERSLYSPRNLIYAGPTWQKTDMNGTSGVTISSDSGGTVGYRRFFGEHLALDFSFSASRHSLKNNGSKFGSYRLQSYTLAAQYHFPASERVRLFAGLGGGVYHLSRVSLEPGWSTKNTAVSWVIQGGATFALTKNIRASAELELGFPRFKSHFNDSSFSMRPSPSTFKFTVGYAF